MYAARWQRAGDQTSELLVLKRACYSGAQERTRLLGQRCCRGYTVRRRCLKRSPVIHSIPILKTSATSLRAELDGEQEGSPAERRPLQLPLARELDEALNSPAYELVLTGMIVTVSGLYAVETLPQLTIELRTILMRIEAFISSIFVVEYLLRFYSQGLDPRYLLRKAMLIDFVSIFPLFVAQGFVSDAFELQFVRLLRVLRILRLERLVEEDTFRRFFLGRADAAYAEYKLRIAQIVFTLASIIWVTSGLIYDAEHGSNPQFQTYFDALYFSIVSLTTVGLGDLAPRTPLGKLTISLAILVGVAIIPFQLGQLGRALFTSDAAHEHGSDGSSFLYNQVARGVECSRCGQKNHSHDARYCRICGERLTSGPDNGQNGAQSTRRGAESERSGATKERA